MRKHYETIFKHFFCTYLFRTRCDQNITQEEMAEQLAMSTRSYVDLDHGKTGCSGLTLALFLVYVCRSPTAFLEDLRNAFDSDKNKAA